MRGGGVRGGKCECFSVDVWVQTEDEGSVTKSARRASKTTKTRRSKYAWGAGAVARVTVLGAARSGKKPCTNISQPATVATPRPAMHRYVNTRPLIVRSPAAFVSAESVIRSKMPRKQILSSYRIEMEKEGKDMSKH